MIKYSAIESIPLAVTRSLFYVIFIYFLFFSIKKTENSSDPNFLSRISEIPIKRDRTGTGQGWSRVVGEVAVEKKT